MVTARTRNITPSRAVLEAMAPRSSRRWGGSPGSLAERNESRLAQRLSALGVDLVLVRGAASERLVDRCAQEGVVVIGGLLLDQLRSVVSMTGATALIDPWQLFEEDEAGEKEEEEEEEEEKGKQRCEALVGGALCGEVVELGWVTDGDAQYIASEATKRSLSAPAAAGKSKAAGLTSSSPCVYLRLTRPSEEEEAGNERAGHRGEAHGGAKGVLAPPCGDEDELAPITVVLCGYTHAVAREMQARFFRCLSRLRNAFADMVFLDQDIPPGRCSVAALDIASQDIDRGRVLPGGMATEVAMAGFLRVWLERGDYSGGGVSPSPSSSSLKALVVAAFADALADLAALAVTNGCRGNPSLLSATVYDDGDDDGGANGVSSSESCHSCCHVTPLKAEEMVERGINRAKAFWADKLPSDMKNECFESQRTTTTKTPTAQTHGNGNGRSGRRRFPCPDAMLAALPPFAFSAASVMDLSELCGPLHVGRWRRRRPPPPPQPPDEEEEEVTSSPGLSGQRHDAATVVDKSALDDLGSKVAALRQAANLVALAMRTDTVLIMEPNRNAV